MYIRSLSELVERLGEALPHLVFNLHMGVVRIELNDVEVATIQADHGYHLSVPRSAHNGRYTDVESLIVSLQLMLRS
jgi:hypothetical protein